MVKHRHRSFLISRLSTALSLPQTLLDQWRQLQTMYDATTDEESSSPNFHHHTEHRPTSRHFSHCSGHNLFSLGLIGQQNTHHLDTGQNDRNEFPSRVLSPMESSCFSNNQCDHLCGRLMGVHLDIVLKHSNVKYNEGAAFVTNNAMTICTLPNQTDGWALGTSILGSFK